MDGSTFVEELQDSKATPLSRLGSEKALVATTEAALDRQSVLDAAAATQARTLDTFEAWTDQENTDRAREAFAEAAAQARTHDDRICGLDGVDAGDQSVDALHGHLRTYEATVDRVAGGLIARPLVASRTLLQVINFFVNEADTRTAELFREIRAETDDQVDTGAAVLEDVCEDWERAGAAAEETVDAAYEEYVQTLEGLGIDPKPVC